MDELRPYEVRIPDCKDRMGEVLEWLSVRSVDGYWWVLNTLTDTCVFEFRYQEDAVMFAMVWQQ